jgi:hypothetical protein
MTSDNENETKETLAVGSELSARLGGWIPCAERLPERQGEQCLVWLKLTGRFGKDISTCAIAEYWIYEPGTHNAETGWYSDDGLDMVEPTHWMILPLGPDA